MVCLFTVSSRRRRCVSVRADQLLTELQNVSQRTRNGYENMESETRLEPIVLNRNLPAHRTQTLNLIRPDSMIEPVSGSKKKCPSSTCRAVFYSQEPPSRSLNELDQLLDALSKAKETMRRDMQSRLALGHCKKTVLALCKAKAPGRPTPRRQSPPLTPTTRRRKTPNQSMI